MPDPFLLTLSFIVGLHVVTIGAATVGWFRVVRDAKQVTKSGEWPSVSVLIPARNEASKIGNCLSSVLQNDYPGELEIVVIDDGSDDNTVAEARRAFASAGEQLVSEGAGSNRDGIEPAYSASFEDGPKLTTRVLEAPYGTDPVGGLQNKTAALTAGVETSTGDVILTTDADCVVGSRWIETMVRCCTPETPMVSGPVKFDWRQKWFDRVQALEMTALVAFGGGTLGAGFPTICNGANVAMRRSLLSEYRTDATVAADELLLQHVAYDTDRDVIFEAHSDAVVETGCVENVSEYIEQRSRWAWMGTRYPYAVPSMVAVSQWFVHASLLAALVAAVPNPSWQPVAVGALLVKMAADGLLVAPAARHLGQSELTRTFIPASLLWIPSAVIVGLLGTFGTVQWKGRRVE